jgi:hypothetical protein
MAKKKAETKVTSKKTTTKKKENPMQTLSDFVKAITECNTIDEVIAKDKEIKMIRDDYEFKNGAPMITKEEFYDLKAIVSSRMSEIGIENKNKLIEGFRNQINEATHESELKIIFAKVKKEPYVKKEEKQELIKEIAEKRAGLLQEESA